MPNGYRISDNQPSSINMVETVFKRPPLVEIVAELRWEVPGLPFGPAPTAPSAPSIADSSAHEIHFMNFASRAGANGFGLIERVIPQGFPLLAYKPAYRYRSTSTAAGAPLFQLGPGVFTVNFIPPYKSWATFLPFIDLGLALLLESWPAESQGVSFSEARLRYIDAFGDHLRQGKSIGRFLAESLGINIQLPPALTQLCTDPEAVKPNLSVSLPILLGSIEIRAGEAWIQNMRSLALDTTVLCKGALPRDKAAILDTMNAAHKIIHDSFIGMTASLHELMEPEQQG